MRSFPNVYVFSGGNVDTHKNETLLKALQREILEETGLTISIHEDAWTLQCVWESVYPTMELMDIMRKDHNKATGNDKMTEEQEPMICLCASRGMLLFRSTQYNNYYSCD